MFGKRKDRRRATRARALVEVLEARALLMGLANPFTTAAPVTTTPVKLPPSVAVSSPPTLPTSINLSTAAPMVDFYTGLVTFGALKVFPTLGLFVSRGGMGPFGGGAEWGTTTTADVNATKLIVGGASGSLNLNGGAIWNPGGGSEVGGMIVRSGTLMPGAGWVTINPTTGITITNTGTGTLTGGGVLTVTNPANGLANGSGMLVLGGTLTNPATLTVTGSGRITLNGSYPAINVNVLSGGTVGGTGTIGGGVTLNAGATLDLTGNGVGTFTAGGLSTSGATLKFDVTETGEDSVALGSKTLSVGDSGSVISLNASGVVSGKSFTLITYTNETAPVGLRLDDASAALATLTVTETSVSVTMNAAT